MANGDRAELERLRKQKRLLELEAKATGAEPLTPVPQPAAEPAPVSQVESALQGAREGATFGFAGELTGKAQRKLAQAELALADIREFFGSEETGPQRERAKATLAKPVSELVAEEEQEIQTAKEANPFTFVAGQIIGGAPAITAATAAGASPTVVGAATAGIQAAGEAEGDLVDRLDEAAMGALFGAAIGKGAETATAIAKPIVSKAASAARAGLDAVADSLKNVGQKLSTKSIKLRKISDLGLRDLKKLGDQLLDKGITSKPALFSTVKKRLERVLKESGKGVKDTYKALDDVVGAEDLPSKQDLVDGIVNKVRETATTEDAAPLVEKELNRFLAAAKRPGNFKPTDMIDLISDIEDQARRFTGSIIDENLLNKRAAQVQISKQLRNNLKDLARKHFPDNFTKFSDDLETFAILKRAETEVINAGKEAFRTGTRSIAGPGVGQRIIESTVASTPIKTGLAGGFNIAQKLVRAPNKLGQFAPVLQAAAERGDSALNAAVFVLSQQSSEFRKLMKAEQEKEDARRERTE